MEDKIQHSKPVPPFVRFCATNIPMVFDNSISYYECLCALWKFIQDDVIDVINNNATVTQKWREELTEFESNVTDEIEEFESDMRSDFSDLNDAFNTLKTWVETYFDNLDVQEEINNKLDQMVEDGTIPSLLSNLVDEYVEETTATLNVLTSDKTVFVGDSYATGENPDSDTLTPWPEIVASLMGLNSSQYNIVAEPGAGFMRTGTGGHTFLTKLQAEIDNITDKNLVKNVILCGGYNDNTYSLDDIVAAIENFVNYCHVQFPNASVFIGEIAYRYQIAAAGALTRDNIASKVYPAYAGNVKTSFTTAKYVYLNGVENILKALPKTYMYADNAHPNQNGQNALGRGIFQAFKTGKCSSYGSGSMQVSNSDATSCSGTIALKHCNELCEIAVTNLEIEWPTGTMSITSNGSPVTICNYSANGFIGGCGDIHNTMPCLISIQDYDRGRHTMNGYLQFATDGTIKIGIWDTATTSDSGTTVSFSNVKQVNIFRSKLVIPDLLA